VLRVNGKDAKISDPVRSGDKIEFSPPRPHGAPIRLKDILDENPGRAYTVNNLRFPGYPAETRDTLLSKPLAS
jgi:hypothetical protein